MYMWHGFRFDESTCFNTITLLFVSFVVCHRYYKSLVIQFICNISLLLCLFILEVGFCVLILKRITRNQVDFNSNGISRSTARLVYYYLFLKFDHTLHLSVQQNISCSQCNRSIVFQRTSSKMILWFQLELSLLFIVRPTNHWYMYFNKN